jgi:antitoxin FitA
MATITLKDVPEELHRRLKEQAARHRRSLNREVIFCLEVAVGGAVTGVRSVDPEAFLAEVRRSRKTMEERGVWITEESLRAGIEEGRP